MALSLNESVNRQHPIPGCCRLPLSRGGNRTSNGEYSSHGGDAYAIGCVADAQHPAVFSGAEHRQLSEAPFRGGGAALSGPGSAGRSGGQKCPHRAESAPCGAHYEERVMHGKITCGG